MRLYRTSDGCYLEEAGSYFKVAGATWNELAMREDLHAFCGSVMQETRPMTGFSPANILAPIEDQEVWAAGVTYFRSRSARIEESKDAGGGDFYDRVYSAERPELFFKATGRRVVGSGDKVRVRRDASWSVPEPELTLLISPGGRINGYTIGNDMSSRDIEGENPLYLPQAKLYDGSCALGPCVYVSTEPLSRETEIEITISRGDRAEFSGKTTLRELKREPAVLVEYLLRENSFPTGCYLMTGTGVVPPDSFTLRSGDRIEITIGAIGTLWNEVA